MFIMTTDFIVLENYDPTWGQKAQDEIGLLQSALPTAAITSIQHIGSTAVPGLSAKPIIDLMITVTDIHAAKSLIPLIEALGYAYWRDNPKKDHLFFVKGLPQLGGTGRTHHLHIFQKDSYEYFAHSLFRDYLQSHLEIKNDYEKLKNTLAMQFKDNREAYTEAKAAFINTISQTAIMSFMRFCPLTIADFNIMHEWFNQPHVQAFYSLHSWRFDEVEKKLMPYLSKTNPVKGFIASLKGTPVAYLQYSPLTHNPWPEQDLPDSVITNGAGIDFFIGAPSLIGKGLGSKVIDAFIRQVIWAQYEYCLADPDIHNLQSIKALNKCGFEHHKEISTTDPLGKPVKLQLMIKHRLW